ncbi:MAG: UDP-N-acetylglucosamine 1-carboxyvinyltransferase [Ruminococcus sp.]|nr:UDP-N-acetylglucosamine 1-carboxyvinyltransferase [Ruminococcus sp.]
MDKFVIKGGVRLNGEVTVSGAKNAVVAILPAIILSDGVCSISNVPQISDVNICIQILEHLGAKVSKLDDKYIIDATKIFKYEVPYELANRMRASYYFLGALLGKYKVAKVPRPGGCHLGDRPIDQHLHAFNVLGAHCDLVPGGDIYCKADRLVGSTIDFDLVSVGSTINAILASVRAEGTTIIENPAKEPHIVDLANFLNSMGANITGAGTDRIKVKGVSKLNGVDYSIIPDQIEAGTYMVAAAATKGDVLIKNVIPAHLEPMTLKLRNMGVHVEEFDDSVRVWVDSDTQLKSVDIKTRPYPGFPTDMQPQFAVLCTLANGDSNVTEGIWDNRFRYVDELRRMGADIKVTVKTASIKGNSKLLGAPVQACDLRAGAALILAGLVATGETSISEIQHIERGYERMDEKLRSLGANIVKKNS